LEELNSEGSGGLQGRERRGTGGPPDGDGLALLTVALAFALDAFERFEEWARRYERWEVDELVAVPLALALGFGAFSWRRWRELRREVAERERAEGELRKLSRAVEYGPSVTVITDPAGRIEYANRRHAEVTGYAAEEVVGARAADLGEMPPEEERRMWEAIGSGREWRGEFRNRRKAGGHYWELASISALRDADGDITHYVKVGEDITERKAAERALRTSEAHLGRAQRMAHLGSWEIDLLAGEMYWSDELYRIFGYEPQAVVPSREALERATHPEDRARIPEAISRAVRERQPFDIEHRVVRPDGEVRHVHARGEAEFDADGRPVVLAGATLDATERVRAEEARRRSERDYRNLFELANDAVLVLDPESETVLDANGRACEMYGFPREEFIGRSIKDLSRDVGRGEEHLRLLLSRGRYDGFETVQYRADGTPLDLVINASVIEFRGRRAVLSINRDVTERKEAEEALRRSEAGLTGAQRIAHVGSCEWDVATGEVRWSDESYRIFGLRPQQVALTAERVLEMLHPEDRDRAVAVTRAALEDGEPFDIEFRVVRPDGQERVVYSRAELTYDDEGRPIRLIGTNLDVTERRRAEEELRASEERFRSLVLNSSDIILVVDRDDAIRYASPSVERLLGYGPAEVEGAKGLDFAHPEDLPRLRSSFRETLGTPGVSPAVELRLRHRDGSWRHFEAVATNLLGDPSVRGVVINSRDVTERKRFEERLRHQALHDPLTDLPNRALLLDRLARALAREGRREGSVAVLFLDLDRFKVANDSYGHEFGDELLVEVAHRLRDCLRPGDTAARFGGDEFVVLVEGMGGAADAGRVAERVARELEAPFRLRGQEVFLSASVGIALNASGEDQPADLLRQADVAMYRAKQGGRARYAAYDPEMSEQILERLALEADLRHALERGQLKVHYQPTVDLSTGRIAGFEALARWHHPERGSVPPADFIPIAEETGLILPMGRWVLEEACRRCRRWQEEYACDPPLGVNVNLSARQFQHPGLSGEAAEVLRETGLEPGSLALEITESVVMEDAESNIEALRRLKALGVRLAIDDFGTGYSSLSYLKRFPVDVLKVDKSFVDGLGQDPEDDAIVRAVITLAHSLGAVVVAEGVETEGQLVRLRELGCELAQGYLFSGPMPAEAAGALLAAGPRPEWGEAAGGSGVIPFRPAGSRRGRGSER
jgi:diguanylate cyclase (GGDEF)-like protein/PAS domain S-box-containing protein